MILDTRILGFDSDSFTSLHQSNGGCAANRYFQIIGNIHDIESYFAIDNATSLNVQIFSSHWGHLGIIFLWVSGNLFHIAWSANYPVWLKNPNARIAIPHGISDVNFGFPASYAYSIGHVSLDVPRYGDPAASVSVNPGILSYSGIYNWLYSVGFSSLADLYNFLIVCELLAVISLLLGKAALIYAASATQWHSLVRAALKSLKGVEGVRSRRWAMFIWPGKLFLAYEDSHSLRLNFHLGVMLGFLACLWARHLSVFKFATLPSVVLGGAKLPLQTKVVEGTAFYTGDWALYSTTNQLTCLGGLKLDTASLASGDIAHHHLSIGVLFLWAGHLCSSIYSSFAHRLAECCAQRKSSAHLKLSLALSGLSVITSGVASHVYALTPYPYLSYDYVTVVALYLHHSSIASFLMVGSFAHAGILLVRDYYTQNSPVRPIYRILDSKSPLISHLSFVSLWLGFHTTGVYVHNDTVSAFGEAEKQILIEPVFSQIILATSNSQDISNLNVVTLPLMGGTPTWVCLGPGDFTAHHAIALGLHLTTLILLKGSLDARGSKLMPEKIHMAWAFACDGPHRGGTCDISAWDSVYLATFWSLNTGSWIGFYFHWKHLALWQNAPFQFDESSSYLNAWFRDYLWFNSSPLIRAYDALGANDLSVWAWLFLAAHLCWATGFMFLISWRGYWQELIDICLYMHLKTPIGYSLLMLDIYTPVALSIVQARALGLFHFGCGTILTYAAFIIGATS